MKILINAGAPMFTAKDIAAAEERGRRSGLEEAAGIAHSEWAALRNGSALERDMDLRMRARADEARTIAELIRATLAPRDSAPARDPYVEAGVDDWAGAPRDSKKDPDPTCPDDFEPPWPKESSK